MFSRDRFNLSRFSLGSQDNIIPIEMTLVEELKQVAGVAIPVETTAFFNDVVRGSLRGAIAMKSTFESSASLQCSCAMNANINFLFIAEDIYVADGPAAGFEKHPGSGNAPGRYNTISGYFSKSGASPLVSITRAAARTGSKAKGSKWSQYDYATWCAVWLLYLVEFADWDSQGTIGNGITNEGTSEKKVGGTDSMTYHTGRAAGTDGATHVQYRWIENPWGNVWEWIDGINFSDNAAYICLNFANYADDTTTNYTAAGVTLGGTSGQYIKDIGVSGTFPWAFLPTATGGSATTYIPDSLNFSTGWRVLVVGGSYTSGLAAGLFQFYANFASSGSGAVIGARLLFHP